MKDGQDAIYYATGDDLAALKKSPQLEGFLAKGVEVLLLTDPIDEFWLPAVGEYQGKPFRSVTESAVDLSKIAGAAEAAPTEPAVPEGEMDKLIAAVKLVLGEAVSDVRMSERLTDSPVCLVAEAGQMSMHLEKLLRAHRQLEQDFPRVLEINPRHALIKGLAARIAGGGAGPEVDDVAHLLLDQARIVEGEPPADPAAFARRMAAVMTRGL
jgi:molecular chaperone HtpG